MPVEIHQIAEHHRDVPTLAGGHGSRHRNRLQGRRRCGRNSGLRVVEVGYRAKHFAPITENNA